MFKIFGLKITVTHLAIGALIYVFLTSGRVSRQTVSSWSGHECLPGDTGPRCTGREGAQLRAMANNCDMATGKNCEYDHDARAVESARTASSRNNVLSSDSSMDVNRMDSTLESVKKSVVNLFD
jgi:hypothetical protein